MVFTLSTLSYYSAGSVKLKALTLSHLSPRTWLASTARASILCALNDSINKGRLHLTDPSGETYTFGNADDQNKSDAVHVKVHDDALWLRLLFSGDLGFAEAYLLGEIDIDNIKGAMDVRYNIPINPPISRILHLNSSAVAR